MVKGANYVFHLCFAFFLIRTILKSLSLLFNYCLIILSLCLAGISPYMIQEFGVFELVGKVATITWPPTFYTYVHTATTTLHLHSAPCKQNFSAFFCSFKKCFLYQKLNIHCIMYFFQLSYAQTFHNLVDVL